MSREIELRLLVPAPVRRFPTDLGLAVIFVFATCLSVLLPIVTDSPIRPLLALPFILFAPGYTLIAVLFPQNVAAAVNEPMTEDRSITERIHPRFENGIDGLERIALSLGTSIAIVPLIGLILSVSPWGIRLLPVLFSVGGFTILMAIVGGVRRWELPEEARFSVPFRQVGASIRAELFESETRTEMVVNILLVICFLVAAASVTYAVVVPANQENSTEFYLLTKNESGFVARDYPTNFTAGESKPVYVGLQNHEHQRENYTIIVLLQRVRTTNHSTTIQREREVARFHASVESNGKWQTKHSLRPKMTGSRLRVQYLLYKGPLPANPTRKNAYRELHHWITVSKGGATSRGA